MSSQTPVPQPLHNPALVGGYRRQLSPKQMEGEVFARASRALREATAQAEPLALARAIADNRRLWDAVLTSVIDPANRLSVPLRAQLAGVARAVLRECDAEAPDAAFILGINEQIGAALWS